MSMDVEFIKPDIGASIRVTPEALTDDAVVQRCLELLEERGVLVFPKIGLTDAQQLAFTDKLGARVNFTTTVSGGDAETQDVYTISLDPKRNPEPEYVLGTFFWHMDGVTSDIVPPKATVLSCRKTSPTGGQTQFASTYRAYEALPEEEKKAYENLRVMHSVTAAVREVAAPEDLEPRKRGFTHEQPLVWHRKSGRKSLIIGYTADYVIGMPKAHGRALLVRLIEWASQPAFTYSHQWQEGDLVIWDNTGALHRVIPYAEDSGRLMHRTSVGGVEAVS